MTEASKDAGFVRHSLAVTSALLDYIKARLQLAGLEAKEALVHFLLIVALAVGALVATLFGYFFFCFGIIFLLAWAFGGGNAWIWVTLGMAVLHVGGAVVALVMAKGRFGKPVFAATLEEFHKDQQWLQTKTARQS